MRQTARAAALVGVVVLSFIACREGLVSLQAPALNPLLQIRDGAHGSGNGDFFFLPPLVKDPTGTSRFNSGQFDATLSPSVEICVVVGSTCAAPQPTGFPIVFTMSSGTERVRLDQAGEFYVVNWKTKDFPLNSAVSYRIRVLVAGTELGHADVDLVATQSEIANVNADEFVALKNGTSLPVKFRIEKGAVFVVGTQGGTVVAKGGAVTITVPPRASPIGVTVDPASGFPADSRLLAGTAFDLGPSGSAFSPPATLAIKYDPSALPSGKYPRLHKVVNGVWTPVAGSTADLANHVVSAPIDGFSTWGVLGTGVVLTVHVVGGPGEVSVEGGDPPGSCSYLSTTCVTDFTPGTNIALIANPLNPDSRFESWTGTGAGFACTTATRCPFTMDQDREVTARFSIPGILSIDRTTAAFAMTRGGALPTAQTAALTNIGGRSITFEPLSVLFAQNVPPWLTAELSATTIAPGDPAATLTLSVLSNTLFPGTYNATVVVRGSDQTLRTVAVSLTINPVGVAITVDGTGRHFGPLPTVIYALADDATGNDVYPLGAGDSYRFGLFDTGASRVAMYNAPPYDLMPTGNPNHGFACNTPNRLTDANYFTSDAGALGLPVQTNTRLRLNGLSAIDGALNAPIGGVGSPNAAQVELPGTAVRPEPVVPGADNLDVTLIGAPVAMRLVTSIDYRTAITRSGYDFYPGLTGASNSGIPGFTKLTSVTGPDITFHPSGTVVPSSFELDLVRFGVPQRFSLTNFAFRHQDRYVAIANVTAPPFHLFDTGTTPTIIGNALASQLGLTAGAGTFSCLSGTNNGYVLDSFIAVGATGTYTVNHASVCWSQADILSSIIGSVIGSNLFDQVRIVLDGPNNKLGIGPAASTPVTWTPPPRNPCARPTSPIAIVQVFVFLASTNLTPGQTTQASVTAVDAAGNNAFVPVTWSTSNPSVATISPTGLVTAHSAGTVSIRATMKGTSGAATLTVSP